MPWTWQDDGASQLASAMTRAGKTNADVAEATGLDPSSVSRFASGARTPKADQLAAMCRVVPGADANVILGLKSPEKKDEEVIQSLDVAMEQLQAAKSRLRR